jgi:hypothetical protein
MLYAGLDLSRKRLDVHVLRERGTTALVTAVSPDTDALRTLARRVAAEGEPVRATIESMNGARFIHDRLEFAESITLRRVLDGLEGQRKQALALNIRGRLGDAELDAELDRIATERIDLDRRVAALEPSEASELPEAAIDLLAEMRARLDAGLTEEQRQEIVRLLVRITIHTETPLEGGRKTARAIAEYRFPAVVDTRTGKGSWPPRAGSAMHLGISLGDPGPPPEMV